MTGNANHHGERRVTVSRIATWAGAVFFLLLIPLIAMQISDDWQWGVFDFVLAFIVLFGAGLTFEFIATKADSLAYKAGVAVAVAGALLLVWVSVAVGIIGDEEAINMLYLGVIAVGLIGAFIGRFEAQGMARAAYAAAIAQMLVPVIAFAIPSLRDLLMEPPGLLGVFALNAVFALFFVGSGLLFQKAAREGADQCAPPA